MSVYKGLRRRLPFQVRNHQVKAWGRRIRNPILISAGHNWTQVTLIYIIHLLVNTLSHLWNSYNESRIYLNINGVVSNIAFANTGNITSFWREGEEWAATPMSTPQCRPFNVDTSSAVRSTRQEVGRPAHTKEPRQLTQIIVAWFILRPGT